MKHPETMKVLRGDSVVIINKSDFNPEIEKAFEEAKDSVQAEASVKKEPTSEAAPAGDKPAFSPSWAAKDPAN